MQYGCHCIVTDWYKKNLPGIQHEKCPLPGPEKRRFAFAKVIPAFHIINPQ